MSTAAAGAATKRAAPNPLLLFRWPQPFGLPPFERIETRHFRPAFERAFARHRAEIARITGRPAAPTFANTIVALEKSGRPLRRVAAVFFNLTGANTNDELQAIERDIAPKLAAHQSAILLDGELYRRVADLFARRDRLKLTDEQRRVLELHHLWFERAGAKLGVRGKKRVASIQGRLALLATQFSQNVLKDEQSWRLVLDGERDLAGLPPSVRAAAARAAKDHGVEGKHVITLARSSVESFLQFSTRRDLREQAFAAWTQRGEHGGDTDNRPIVAEIVALRGELARLLGYASFAEYSLAETMAKTPEAVRELLSAVWPKAIARVEEEREALEARIAAEGGNYKLAAWDWRYLAEKERKARFDIDDAEIRPYFALDNMIAAAFDTASRLFGLAFREIEAPPRYHPDVRAWEVTGAQGKHVGVFLGDYFARPSKRSGAWMSDFRAQHKLLGEVRPVIVNVMNFARGADGEPTLLSFDDARTLFHEFGHGLHGLLSDVTYPSISGTSVVTDFVELPSQLFEHWLLTAEVLERFARHIETGKSIPSRLVKRLEAARAFNQGFATVEYAACAFVDLELHEKADAGALDVSRFERETLARLGMPREIVMRHRVPHFLHIVGGYAAGYYSYLWSEVLDADAFAAFREAGNVFDAAVAGRLRDFIYTAGNRRDPMDAYIAFRRRPPEIEHLMRKRGFVTDAPVV